VPAVDTEPLPKKTRVRVTSSLSGVPEGTAGSVQGTVGFALPRHRVAFDNGRFVTSVARTRLVREDEWDEFLAAREREAEAATEAAAAPIEAKAVEKPSGDAAPAADDRLAALAARSKAAREKKAAGG
jgi:hypothetical protein